MLKDKYPSLSTTDLKKCALIQLGLPSKEMADIMAIGADSVSASRSRIRKKMNLTRDVNLVEYLGSIN
ncbi:helix-turn-helix transcriptional regulator [Saccharicrinis aurantiacus]|uniref:helix-turn-helix transcriptional regulator n=1 Tax=Saccharicrinis aurantiacus TaxID=1849719 RepID=UPI0021D1D59C|nr:LuxR C-terminal-related transcriptional regulator [Saccharicrinis aurantiacus]